MVRDDRVYSYRCGVGMANGEGRVEERASER